MLYTISHEYSTRSMYWKNNKPYFTQYLTLRTRGANTNSFIVKCPENKIGGRFNL